MQRSQHGIGPGGEGGGADAFVIPGAWWADGHPGRGGAPCPVPAVDPDRLRLLERAMVAGRRWALAEARRLVLDHPLLRATARGLVWVAGDGAAFRVAPDGTLAGVDGRSLDLADGERVGIAHPVELGAALDAWVGVFAAREILQPFPQLGRSVRVLSGDERGAVELTAFHGHTVSADRVAAMAERGWELDDRGGAFAGGRLSWALRGDRAVVVELGPAVPAAAHGSGSGDGRTITRVRLGDGSAEGAGTAGPRCFGSLDPGAASEVLSDLIRLVAAD
ncbi:DUF4132 domain-containing protein [Nocardiopsis mangrovi]|uniref:DUF4132 domain-containing protein n=1 Tax=Nocardiopsis mangrovi TaxID=1179818 RepID=A0ABV9DS98_9ACTN